LNESGPSPSPPGEASLAGERTDLAWNRSGLSVLVCLVLILRRLWPLNATGVVVALACIAAGAVVWIASLWAGRRVATRASAGTLGPGVLKVISAGTLVFAAAGFILTVVSVH
jgi:hypothetical protein